MSKVALTVNQKAALIGRIERQKYQILTNLLMKTTPHPSLETILEYETLFDKLLLVFSFELNYILVDDID